MTKKVNFYSVSLCSSVNESEELDYTKIKDYIAEIIASVASQSFLE